MERGTLATSLAITVSGLLLFGSCGEKETPRSNGATCASNTQCSSALCHFQTCVLPEADDDLDGLINAVEAIAGTNPLESDTDGDTHSDYIEVGAEFRGNLELSAAHDQDEDGTIDALESFLCDTDCDGHSDQNDDLINDTQEANNVPMTPLHRPEGCVPLCLVDAQMVIDDDNDGVPNEEDNCLNTPNPPEDGGSQLDTDADGAGDACDEDDDEDGVLDDDDNCPLIANADQLDTDDDGLGDACDEEEPVDQDGDGVPDDDDNCPTESNPPEDGGKQLDTDDDGQGDACDDDDDGDGVLDADDNCPNEPNPTEDGGSQVDTDDDDEGDACDKDDDGDGKDDLVDCYPLKTLEQKNHYGDVGLGTCCSTVGDTCQGEALTDEWTVCEESGCQKSCPLETLNDNFEGEAAFLGWQYESALDAESIPPGGGLEVVEGGANGTQQSLQISQKDNKVTHPLLKNLYTLDLEFWFKWQCCSDTEPPEEQLYLRAHQKDAESTLWSLSLNAGTTSGLTVRNEDDKDVHVPLSAPDDGEDLTLSLGEWHQVRMRRQAGGKLELWIEGQSISLAGAPIPQSGPVDVSLEMKEISGSRLDEVTLVVGSDDCGDP